MRWWTAKCNEKKNWIKTISSLCIQVRSVHGDRNASNAQIGSNALDASPPKLYILCKSDCIGIPLNLSNPICQLHKSTTFVRIRFVHIFFSLDIDFCIRFSVFAARPCNLLALHNNVDEFKKINAKMRTHARNYSAMTSECMWLGKTENDHLLHHPKYFVNQIWEFWAIMRCRCHHC